MKGSYVLKFILAVLLTVDESLILKFLSSVKYTH